MVRGKEKSASQGETPVMPPFVVMDRATREAFERYCEVEMSRVRLQQQQLDSDSSDRSEIRQRTDRENEPRLLIENARAQAEAQKIADAAALEQARVELEICKLRAEGRRLEGEALVSVAAKAAEVFWPRVEQLGAGIMRLNLEQFQLLREEMRLLAGRDPVTGRE